MTWFGVIKVMSDDMDKCCSQIRERIRLDRMCVRFGVPGMIETMECEEIRNFLISMGEKKPVIIPDGREINFNSNTTLAIHMQDIADIFHECLEGPEDVSLNTTAEEMGHQIGDWRSRFT